LGSQSDLIDKWEMNGARERYIQPIV